MVEPGRRGCKRNVKPAVFLGYWRTVFRSCGSFLRLSACPPPCPLVCPVSSPTWTHIPRTALAYANTIGPILRRNGLTLTGKAGIRCTSVCATKIPAGRPARSGRCCRWLCRNKGIIRLCGYTYKLDGGKDRMRETRKGVFYEKHKDRWRNTDDDISIRHTFGW
jgi:hypothetical protein